MNNNKRIYLSSIFGIVILTALLFLLPVERLLITGYIFGVAGIIVLCSTLLWGTNRKRGEYVTTAAFPLAAFQYLVTNILFSIIIIVLKEFDAYTMAAGWFFFIHLAITVFFIWKILAMDSGKEEIEAVGTEVKLKISRWKDFELQLSTLSTLAAPEVKKEISTVYDALRYTDPMSDERLNDIENAIAEKIVQLSENVKSEKNQETVDLCQQLLTDIKIRNKQCKIYK